MDKATLRIHKDTLEKTSIDRIKQEIKKEGFSDISIQEKQLADGWIDLEVCNNENNNKSVKDAVYGTSLLKYLSSI